MIDTLMIAATTGVCSYVAGIVTMGWFTIAKIARLRDDLFYAETDCRLAEDLLKVEKEANRRMGRELATHRAEKRHLDAQRRLAGEKGRASQTAKRLEREAAARELTNARHAEMRKIVGELV